MRPRAVFHSPTQEIHTTYFGQLGDNVSVSVGYQPSTGLNYFHVCAAGCQDESFSGTPDLSRAFYIATMNIYAPNGDVNAPPAMWIQAPEITQRVVFGPVDSVLNPSDSVLCDFNQWGYTNMNITPSYTSNAPGTSVFSLTFSYW